MPLPVTVSLVRRQFPCNTLHIRHQLYSVQRLIKRAFLLGRCDCDAKCPYSISCCFGESTDADAARVARHQLLGAIHVERFAY